ncbi:MAG: hypothetical protein EZS28_021423 [Streblomastix strix]|uniref:Uncharacterized protein n=1 Tax=Streblomastix strix TaxID=222440 RepID=A0A5J4VKE7_9EUKA|nr:MAG: hypothetical protein EZS28_021423 [Streblomastix strix]
MKTIIIKIKKESMKIITKKMSQRMVEYYMEIMNVEMQKIKVNLVQDSIINSIIVIMIMIMITVIVIVIVITIIVAVMIIIKIFIIRIKPKFGYLSVSDNVSEAVEQRSVNDDGIPEREENEGRYYIYNNQCNCIYYSTSQFYVNGYEEDQDLYEVKGESDPDACERLEEVDDGTDIIIVIMLEIAIVAIIKEIIVIIKQITVILDSIVFQVVTDNEVGVDYCDKLEYERDGDLAVIYLLNCEEDEDELNTYLVN